MSKYSYQFKKEVVQAYLEGKGSCAFFAKQYGIKSKSQIRRWINKQEKKGKRPNGADSVDTSTDRIKQLEDE